MNFLTGIRQQLLQLGTALMMCSCFMSSANAQSNPIIFGGPDVIVSAAFQPTAVTVANSCSNSKAYVLRVAPQSNRLNVRLIRSAGDDDLGCLGGIRTTFLPPLPAGDYALYSYVYADESNIENYAPFNKTLRVTATAPTIRVSNLAFTIFLNPSANPIEPTIRYFMTAIPAEVSLLLNINVQQRTIIEPIWRHADNGFLAWAANAEAPAAAKGVCRFFSPVTSSHFYSLKPEECALLKARPNEWVDEGIAFRILAPEGGACGFGTQPIYRAFSTINRNHRYTAEADTYRAILLDGWQPEGVAFCAPLQ